MRIVYPVTLLSSLSKICFFSATQNNYYQVITSEKKIRMMKVRWVLIYWSYNPSPTSTSRSQKSIDNKEQLLQYICVRVLSSVFHIPMSVISIGVWCIECLRSHHAPFFHSVMGTCVVLYCRYWSMWTLTHPLSVVVLSMQFSLQAWKLAFPSMDNLHSGTHPPDSTSNKNN